MLLPPITLIAASLIAQSSGSQAEIRNVGTGQQVVYLGKTVHATRQRIVGLRTLHIDGAVTILWSEAGREFAALSADGRTIGKILNPNYVLPMRYQRFDPLQSVPAIAPEYAFENPRLRIVQFCGQPLPEHAKAIKEAGGEVCRYLPDTAFICDGNEAAYDRIAKIEGVRWIGAYQPAYRTFPELLWAKMPTQKYVIELKNMEMATKFRAASQVASIGGIIDNENAGSNLIEATLTQEQFRAALRLEDVFFAAPKGEPSEDMDIARQISNATFVETLGLTGQGVRGEVMDGNMVTNHVAFVSNGRAVTVHTAGSGSQTHGTNTSGIVFGDGTGNASGKGMLPNGYQIFAGYTNFGGGSRYIHTQQLVSSPYFAVFQSNSWGNPQVLNYTSVSQEMDRLILDHGLLILNSQSNTGNQSSRPEAWAKNVVSIGGVFHNNTLDRADDRWTSASYGPAEDGRIKPDLAHFYDNVTCANSSSTSSYTTSFSGTSAATPIVAGISGLLFQMWAEGMFGQSNLTPRNPADRFIFDSRCKFTTAKALLINGAYQYDPVTTNLTRFKQGWGMPDLKPLYDNRLKMLIVDETDTLTNLQARTYKVYVPSGTTELKATMTYADLPGTTSSTLHRINDLSLRVISPQNNVYFGNNGLTNSKYSSVGGTFDSKNTVENVILQNPTAGVWTIEVSAPILVIDARPETPDVVDTDYALVVSGCAPTAVVSSAQPQNCSLLSGDVGKLESSNDQNYVVQWNANPLYDELAYFAVEFNATCPIPSALADLKFRIEESATVPDLSFAIDLFDYGTNAWVNLLSGDSSTTTRVRTVGDSTNPNRFVQNGTNAMKARVRYFGDPLLLSSIQSVIDQARWFVTPQ